MARVQLLQSSKSLYEYEALTSEPDVLKSSRLILVFQYDSRSSLDFMATIVDADTPLSFVTSNFTSHILGLCFAGLLNGDITSLSKNNLQNICGIQFPLTFLGMFARF